jgi:hypothetical protein
MFKTAGGPGGFEVYGNIFANLSQNHDATQPQNGIMGGWSLVDGQIGSYVSGMKVYNNTFISFDAETPTPIISSLNDYVDVNEVRNNLVYGDTSVGAMGSITTSHNHFVDNGSGVGSSISTGSGDPFVNWLGTNFSLKANTPAGTSLGAPYNVDMFGNTRTTWTRGALEYGSTDIRLSLYSYDFGVQATNSTNAITITITNTGVTSLSGTCSIPAGPFSVLNGSPYTIATNATAMVTLIYTPATTSDSVTATFTGGGGATVTLAGQLDIPEILLGMSFQATNGTMIGTRIRLTNGVVTMSAYPEDTNTVAGHYTLYAMARSGDLSGMKDSMYVSIDTQTAGNDALACWDIIPQTTNWTNMQVSIRGGGTVSSNQFNPMVFSNLTADAHWLYVAGREDGAQVSNWTFTAYSGVNPPEPPTSLRAIFSYGGKVITTNGMAP